MGRAADAAARALIRVATVVVALWVLAPGAAGGTLPLVRMETDGATWSWWAAGSPAPDWVARMDGIWTASPWIDPGSVQPREAPSRVLRRPDLSDNNARALAGLYDARVVAIGSIRSASAIGVPWLDLAAWEVSVDIRLVAVDDGRELGRVVLRETAYGVDGHLASWTQARERLARHPALASGRGASDLLPTAAGIEVIVRMPSGSAAEFVTFRRVLSGVHPSIREVSEAWATEGGICLSVRVDGDPSAALEAIRALAGRSMDGVSIVAAGADGARVGFRVEPVAGPDVVMP